MLGLEIGQRESGFYSERTESQMNRITDGQNHRITEPHSTVLVYRLFSVISNQPNSLSCPANYSFIQNCVGGSGIFENIHFLYWE